MTNKNLLSYEVREIQKTLEIKHLKEIILELVTGIEIIVISSSNGEIDADAIFAAMRVAKNAIQ